MYQKKEGMCIKRGDICIKRRDISIRTFTIFEVFSCIIDQMV